MRKKVGISVIVVAVIAVIAVGYAVSNSGGRNGSVITMGFIGPLSGDGATYGEPISNAVRLAVADINATGGVDGKKVEVIYEDGKCTGPDALAAAQKLISVDEVKMIIGGICSGETLAMAPVAEQAKVIVISPSATSPDITNAGDFIFRNVPSDAYGGEVLAKLVAKKYKNAAIISENTDFAQAMRKVFLSNFKALDGNVVTDESYNPDTTDFRSMLTKIKAANPDVLIINPQSEIAGGTIIKQARQIAVTVPFYGNIMLASKALQIAGSYAEGLTFIDAPGLNPQNERATQFLSEYTAKYGEPPLQFYLGAAYDDVHILADAIRKAGTNTEKIRDYLYGLKDYSGVIGTYGFDKNGDLAGIEFLVKQVKDGKVIEVQ